MTTPPYDFVMAVAAGHIDDVGEIATTLASWQASQAFSLEGVERFLGELTDPFK